MNLKLQTCSVGQEKSTDKKENEGTKTRLKIETKNKKATRICMYLRVLTI